VTLVAARPAPSRPTTVKVLVAPYSQSTPVRAKLPSPCNTAVCPLTATLVAPNEACPATVKSGP
jgi:hypothetical protein